jgi:hypothetical protein
MHNPSRNEKTQQLIKYYYNEIDNMDKIWQENIKLK